MKKALSFVILSLFISISMFAAGYKVTSITGKVTYEATPGNWKDVTVGQELTATTVLNTSLNSSVEIELEDGNNLTIKAMQKGTVDSLIGVAAKSNKKSGVKKSAVAAGSTKTTKGTATASSRASEAKSDLDWDEE